MASFVLQEISQSTFFVQVYPRITNKLSKVFKVLVFKEKYYYLLLLNTDLNIYYKWPFL